MSGVEHVIQNAFAKSDNMTGKALAMGVNYSLANDAVHYLLNKQSKLLDMNYRGFFDDVVYNGALYHLATGSGVASNLYTTVSNVSPLPSEMNSRLLTSSIVVGGQLVRNVINESPTLSNTPLSYITNASQLIPQF